jgi:Tfp pilus assembly protein PilF
MPQITVRYARRVEFTARNGLPNFFEKLDAGQDDTARFIETLAKIELGDTAGARKLLETVLQRAPSRALAKDPLAGL